MKYFAELRCPPGTKYDTKTKSCVPVYSKRSGYARIGFYGRPSMNGNGKKANGNGNGNGANGNGGNGGNGGGNGSGGNGGGGNGGGGNGG